MKPVAKTKSCVSFLAGLLLLILPAAPVLCQIHVGPEELVQANGMDIMVPGYSVPSFTYWDGDALMDLVVGEGSGTFPNARVRVYLNTGTVQEPLFQDFFYAQSEGADLTVPGSG
jgi:hypothetical protein